MDRSRRQRTQDRARHIALGVICLLMLCLSFVASERAGIDLSGIIEAGDRGLRDKLWMLPLALAVVVAVIASSRVERRWPEPKRRALLALVILIGLYVLPALIGLFRTLVILGLVGVVALIVAWVLVVPRRLAPPLGHELLGTLPDRDRIELADARLKLQNDIRTTALQAVAGVAVLAGAILAFQQLTEDRNQAIASQELTRQGQASERFTRAIDQLGSERLEVRLGGIYGLEQVAEQAPDNRLPVTEVLAAYLRRKAPRKTEATPQPSQALPERAPDVQAAITVLTRRTAMLGDPIIDLSGLDLRGARIGGEVIADDDVRVKAGKLYRVNFSDADLRGARFPIVYMEGANFSRADLRGASFDDCQFFLDHADDLPGHPDRGELDDCGMSWATFDDALVDKSTKWPSDLPPKGVRIVP